MKYKLDVVTYESWQKSKEKEYKITGFSLGLKPKALKVKPGDYFICYMHDIQRWVGLLEVVSKCYENQKDIIWRARKNGKEEIFPIRFDVKPIITLEPEYAVPLDSLAGRLSIYQPGVSATACRRRLRSCFNGLDEDAKIIIAELEKARNNPILYPIRPSKKKRSKNGLTGTTEVKQIPEELSENELKYYPEGMKTQITVNAYERSQEARKECLKHWGYECVVCGFIFEEQYGELGKCYIHVHHLIPVSKIGKFKVTNARNDLRPVCPNCHAMLHHEDVLTGKTLTIEQLKEVIEKQKNSRP